MRRLAWVATGSLAAAALMTGCGSTTTPVGPSEPLVATPAIVSTPALNGAAIVSLSDSVDGATMYYTVDGSAPSAASNQYFAPMLVMSDETINAVAVDGAGTSAVASKTFAAKVASGSLAWSDEFNNAGTANSAPDATVWTYDTGNSGFGNQELENYCAWGAAATPCDTSNSNAYVGTDGYLHIVARQPTSGVYTSARLKTQGLFSTAYGRLEARINLPTGQGLWPAFWLLGSDYVTVNWPACGEQDIMEHINVQSPDWVLGSVHMPNENESEPYPPLYAPGFMAGGWHTYGMIWAPGSVKYYVDSPDNVYASYTPSDLQGIAGAVWPFDSGKGNFIILNLAVGGSWPGAPDATTVFPAEMLVDYVRVYAN